MYTQYSGGVLIHYLYKKSYALKYIKDKKQSENVLLLCITLPGSTDSAFKEEAYKQGKYIF